MAENREYVPGGNLLAAALALLAVHALMLVVAFGSSAMQYQLMRKAEATGISDAEAEANDAREAAVGMVQLGVYLFVGVVFLSALYRANSNAHDLGAADLPYTPGWTVGWFFVPIMSLFKPYLAVRETWRASDPAHRDWKENRGSALLSVWWTLWLSSIVIDRVSMALGGGAVTIPDLKAATAVTMFAEVVSLVLTAVAAAMLYRLFRRQEARRRAFAAESPACPACGEPAGATDDRCAVYGAGVRPALGFA